MAVDTEAKDAGETNDVPADEKAEIERLRSQCATYKDMLPKWEFYLLSYEGGTDYVTPDQLFKHQREHTEDFKDRLNRAHYLNLCQPLTDFVPEFIFNQPIDRQAKGSIKADYDAFITNVDRAGNDINKFMQMSCEESRIFGHVFVQVEMPVRPAGKVSRADELAQSLDKPYLVRIRPMEVLDWRMDALGRYAYLKRVQHTFIEKEDASGSISFTDVEFYYEWYRRNVKVSCIDITDPDKPRLVKEKGFSKANKLGMVPFIPIVHRPDKASNDGSVSFLKDLAFQNRHVFNLTSLIGEFLYRQCFNVLAMQGGDGQVPTVDKIDGTMGNSNVLEVPGSAKNMPQFLTPPTEPAEFIQSERTQTIEDMYRQASQSTTAELFARSNGSGDAQKQAFGRSAPVIARTADMLQSAEVEIATLWSKMKGGKWDGKIAYKDSFDTTSMQDLILQMTGIFNSLKILSPTFIREQWKRMVREFDGRLPVETLEKIYKELDGLSDEEVKTVHAGLDVQATKGIPSASNMIQGKDQARLKTDKNRSLASGSKASTKEAVPDRKSKAKAKA
jgi:hypothetical protein